MWENLSLFGCELVQKEMDQPAALDLGEKHNCCKQLPVKYKLTGKEAASSKGRYPVVR